MAAAPHPPGVSDWQRIASLGEQLVGASSLVAKRNRILSVTAELLEGDVDVWLQENIFRLPDRSKEQLFPAQPPLDGMRRAIKTHRICTRNGGKNVRNPSASAAVPLEDQGLLWGALQVTRPHGPRFSKDELALLESLARIIAVGLYASHRVEVEHFRMGQLNLVRDVSAQIANVLDVDELARRVTHLIQKTFHFYYVAIFTQEPGATLLHFRSSASAPRKGRKKVARPLAVEIGQGLIGEAAENGQQLVSDDVRADPRYRFVDSLPETRSEVVIPLKIEDRVLGVLDVQSDLPSAFHPNDLLVLNALADNIARAIESARLYGDLRRRADQLTLIAEVSKSLTSTLDLRELMHDAASLIHDRFGYPHVHLFSVHPNRRLIEYVAGSGKRSRSLEGYTLSLDEPKGIIPWAVRNGQTVLANDVSVDERYTPSPLPPRNTRAELAVPLQFNNRVIGILDIQSDDVNAFSEDDRLIFEAVADSIASAMRNADLYRSERWRRQVADSLREVAGLVSANVGVEQVLETILVELERNLAVDIAAIWLVGENGLFPAAVHGADAQAIEAARLDSPDASIVLTSSLLAEGPIIRRPGDARGPAGLAAGFPEDYSSLAAPLRVGDEPLGIIVLAHHTPGRYGHEAQAMASTFASYAAVAIENARLYDSAQEQAYASAALLQVAQAVVSLNDLDEILGTIVRIMPILVGVERAALYLWDPLDERFMPAHQYGLPDEARAMLWSRDFHPGQFPLLDAARDENRLLTHALRPRAKPQGWPRLKPTLEAAENHLRVDNRLLMAVPLAIKSDQFGVLLVEEALGGRRFRSRRIEIINGIAQQAALAIQNDRLQREMMVRERLETEVQLARQIQQTFIPHVLPSYPSWDLSALWRTARQVGGDFYDVMELPGQRLGLFIADVADKGIPAALFMALTRTLVRAAVIETESPADALRRVNDLLVTDTEQGMFVTAFYAVLELDTGLLTYANAGHNPPFLLHSMDGSVQKLTRTGVALGAVEHAPMSERNIELGQGDSLLLYTDGLTEAFSPSGELFGEERLVGALQSHPMNSAGDVVNAVEEHLNEFLQATPLADDLTMLVVQRSSASPQ
jgi:GAF domain-containing protein